MILFPLTLIKFSFNQNKMNLFHFYKSLGYRLNNFDG
jgi:hypothetical protein